jgi:uncharacterized membrane protein (UPF0127 family)
MLAALLIALSIGLDGGGQPPLPLSVLAIEVDAKQQRFTVELANTPETREAGLMFRRSAPPLTGMLFDYLEERDGIAFWMKNTLIPLDILFIDGKGEIIRIAGNTKPLSLTPIPAGGPCRLVLEIAGGEAARLGIRPGQRVKHHTLGQPVR